MPFLLSGRSINSLRSASPRLVQGPQAPGARDLGAYLREHAARARSAARLAHEASSRFAGTPSGDLLAEVATEISSDQRVILRLLARFEPREREDRSHLAAEPADPADSEGLGRAAGDRELVEVLESLLLAVEARAFVWLTLRRVSTYPGEVTGVDLDRLIVRAARQRRILDRERTDAAIRAFSSSRELLVSAEREPGA